MDSIQHLANDSFSYRWFLNFKPAFDALDDACRTSFDAFDEACYIDMDPKMIHLKRASNAQDSNFNFPPAQPLDLIHADELFSNGQLMPLHLLSPPKLQSTPSNDLSAHVSSRPTLLPSESSTIVLSTPNLQSAFLQRCRRSSKRILSKYLGFLRPLYRRVRGKRSPPPRMVNCVESLQVTPRTSTTFSTSDWCHNNMLFDSDIDNLIYDAVLHCKKSTEKQGVDS
ncbi:probable membrane-associated kinase regulator 6 [Magnolia sinica]|uniref:probable membrane-associated kinase regulator 6 n=1 Tax=Magnolia sinica TaxID=86752 RepID=UPI00265A5EFD|nr:probable membrane-associated kinase regulator 6 [Magnolia sinica]